ncbi:hypothetical protein [Pilibacter termitis]|nr:hypothetical protein [Pilibacter termitis]
MLLHIATLQQLRQELTPKERYLHSRKQHLAITSEISKQVYFQSI